MWSMPVALRTVHIQTACQPPSLVLTKGRGRRLDLNTYEVSHAHELGILYFGSRKRTKSFDVLYAHKNWHKVRGNGNPRLFLIL